MVQPWIAISQATLIAVDGAQLLIHGKKHSSPYVSERRLSKPRPMSIMAKRLDMIRMPIGTEVGLGPGDVTLC